MGLSINSYNSSSISALFSGLSANKKGVNNSFGFDGMLSDYYQIKNGSYSKLMKSYYKAYGTDEDGNVSIKKNSETDTKTLSSIKSDSDSLKKATSALLEKSSSKSIWNTKTSTDENGKSVTEYDKDKIYKALSDFAESYNDLVDSGQKATKTNMLSQVAGMVTSTSANASMLASVGISIDSKSHISIDEEFFKKDADMNKVKSLFSGTGSYAYGVMAKASMANSMASAELSNQTGMKFYTNSGTYAISASDMVSQFSTTT